VAVAGATDDEGSPPTGASLSDRRAPGGDGFSSYDIDEVVVGEERS
jgi:hypothetical protein